MCVLSPYPYILTRVDTRWRVKRRVKYGLWNVLDKLNRNFFQVTINVRTQCTILARSRFRLRGIFLVFKLCSLIFFSARNFRTETALQSLKAYQKRSTVSSKLLWREKTTLSKLKKKLIVDEHKFRQQFLIIKIGKLFGCSVFIIYSGYVKCAYAFSMKVISIRI